MDNEVRGSSISRIHLKSISFRIKLNKLRMPNHFYISWTYRIYTKKQSNWRKSSLSQKKNARSRKFAQIVFKEYWGSMSFGKNSHVKNRHIKSIGKKNVFQNYENKIHCLLKIDSIALKWFIWPTICKKGQIAWSESAKITQKVK